MRVAPFPALRPPAALAKEIASVPYDVVNTEEARALAEGNPKSFLHIVRPEIDLPDDTNPYDDKVYAQARAALDHFRKEGWLALDEEPALYLYRQQMGDESPLGAQSQAGIVACCHVDDYPALIKRHELTRKAKEDDRTRHVLTTEANTGPVFLTFRDEKSLVERSAALQKTAPLYDFTAVDGVRHSVWRIDDPAGWVKDFERVPCAYVADGHHRTASAVRAGQERRAKNPGHTGDEEYNWFLTVLFPASELKILPYHRVLLSLNGMDEAALLARLAEVGTVTDVAEAGPPSGAFDLYVGGAWHRVTFDPKSIDRSDVVASLDVALVQDRVLGPLFGIDDPRSDDRIDFVGGIHGTGSLKKRVDAGKAVCAIAMPATTIEQLLAVADAGEIMPPKSTWFEPKLRSGLFVHPIG